MNTQRRRPSWLKRRLIVDWKLQILILYHSLLPIVIMAILTGIGSRVFDSSNFVFAHKMSLGTLIFGGAALILFFLATLSSIVLTNRVAGPILRLQEHMQKVADGAAIEEICFRKGDQFPQLASAYNALLVRLHEAEKPKSSR